jgi:nuclear cap-binding protein subunit 1
VLTLSGALPHHLASVFGPQRATVRNFVAEALFSQMLRLPGPALSHAAYCTVLVDLCKVPHFQFARALSSCVRELFGCMPYMDPELRFRLASWLSYHLSSFNYQWPWDRWQWVSERPPHDPQRGFCVLLLHRLLRLADYMVVKQVGLAASSAVTNGQDACWRSQPRFCMRMRSYERGESVCGKAEGGGVVRGRCL